MIVLVSCTTDGNEVVRQQKDLMEKTEQHLQRGNARNLFQCIQEQRKYLLGDGSWQSLTIGYLASPLLQGIALLVAYTEQRIGISPYLSSVPFSFAAMLIAWLWGIGPAILAIGIGFLILDYFILDTLVTPPLVFLGFNGWKDVLMYSPHIFGELVVILIINQRKRSQLRALAAERDLYIREAERELYIRDKELALLALAQSHQRIEEISQQHEQENRRRDIYISQASHDLKTPLTTVLLQTQLSLRRLAKLEPVASERQALQTSLEQINIQTQRLNALIDALLAIHSLRSGKFPLRLTECRLGELLREVAVEQQALSGRCIELELPSVPVILQADAQRMMQVLTNLVTNAIKYSPQNSPVEVRASLEASRAICTVHNNSNHPISSQDQARIFEPFYRAAEERHPSIGGWGLGLSICKEIVEQHKGEIWVKSSELYGTTFFVSLPCSTT